MEGYKIIYPGQKASELTWTDKVYVSQDSYYSGKEIVFLAWVDGRYATDTNTVALFTVKPKEVANG
jgi:hypothetical protein